MTCNQKHEILGGGYQQISRHHHNTLYTVLSAVCTLPLAVWLTTLLVG